MGTAWSSLLLVWLSFVSSGNLECTSSLSDPTLAVDTTGWETDITGWEVDITGWEADITGWEADITGWELLVVTDVVADNPLTLVEIPVVDVAVDSSELVPIFLFIMLSSTCDVICHMMY